MVQSTYAFFIKIIIYVERRYIRNGHDVGYSTLTSYFSFTTFSLVLFLQNRLSEQEKISLRVK